LQNLIIRTSCLSKNTYSFTDSSSGKPTSIVWNFGDGNVQAGIKNPVNSYPVSGEFRTVLSLHDAVTGVLIPVQGPSTLQFPA
jgi:hypothetical protein